MEASRTSRLEHAATTNPLSADERIRLFGEQAFWPFSGDEFSAIAALLPKPASTQCIDHVLQAARTFAVNKRRQAKRKPNPRDEIAKVAKAVDELLIALQGLSLDAQMCFYDWTERKSDDAFDLRRAAETFASRHRELLSTPPPVAPGGQAFKREERRLIAQMRAAYRAAHPSNRNPQGFWEFFRAITGPLGSVGLSDALAGEGSDPATWKNTWEKIEQRSRTSLEKPSNDKGLNKRRT
jgi:hypothetical protein